MRAEELARILIRNNITAQGVREIALAINGGPGSGNWGHSGRPGLVGGSGKGSGGISRAGISSYERYRKAKMDQLRKDIESRLKPKKTPEEEKAAVLSEFRSISNSSSLNKDEWTKKLVAVGYDEETARGLACTKYKNLKVAEIEKSRGTPNEWKKKNRTESKNKTIEAIDSKTAGFASEADKKWFRNNADERMVNALNESIDSMSKEYGLDPKNLKITEINAKNTLGKTERFTVQYRSSIGLNTTRMMTDADIYKANETLQKEVNWHTSGETDQTIRHELGHALVVQRAYEGGIKPTSVDRYASFIVYRAAREVAGVDVDGKFIDLSSEDRSKVYDAMKSMSRYGKTSAAEAVAEAIANPNYSDYAKAISDNMKKKFTYQDLSRFAGYNEDQTNKYIKANDKDKETYGWTV